MTTLTKEDIDKKYPPYVIDIFKWLHELRTKLMIYWYDFDTLIYKRWVVKQDLPEMLSGCKLLPAEPKTNSVSLDQ